MTESANPSSAIESKLMRLRGRIEQVVAESRRRQFVTAVVMAGLLLAAGGYLWYLYSKIAEFADAATVVELAAAQVEPQLDAEVARFEDTLKAQAPLVLDQAEKAVLAAPPQVARELQNYLGSFLDTQLSSLEAQTYEVVSRTLEDSIAKAREQGVDLNDDKQLDELVDSAAPLMRETLQKAIDQLYAEYREGATNVVAYIEELTYTGEGKKLTPLQESQREILLTGLAIIKKLEADPSRAPLQNVIESLK